MLLKKLVLISICQYVSIAVFSQITGTDAFIKSSFVEAGISSCGCYGSTGLPPAGYHANSATGELGFLADYDMGGWTIGSPVYCGDFFLPGNPEEGWGVEMTGVNYGNYGQCNTDEIPGFISSYTDTTHRWRYG